MQSNTTLQGRYRVIEHIGRGGMGSVYKADDLRLHMTVALKQTLVSSEGLRKAFIREAQLLASLRHATIPRVIDHFVDENGQFLVMEYIPGDDLDEVLRQRQQPFDLPDVLRWAEQLLNALDYLHTREPAVVHRDIKPKNLKLTEKGDIVLLDFGLAKSSLLEGQGTLADSIFGFTPHYAPLEQINGTGTDRRSDLYSLAATLYHLLTGVMPVDATSRAVALINHEPDPLLPADYLNPQVPPAVAAILNQALAQKAAERPLTAAAIRQALREADMSMLPYESGPRSEEYAYEAQNVTEIATKARTTIKMAHPGRSRRLVSALLLVPVLLAGGSWAAYSYSISGISGPNKQQPTAVAAAEPSAAPSIAATPEPLPSSAPEPPQPMSGSVNIAIAELSAGEQNGCTVQPDEAHGISMALWSTLAERIGASETSLSDLELMSPEQTGTLSGTTTEQLQAKARALNADVIVYGSVRCDSTPRRTQLAPAVYVSDRKLQSYEQLEFIGARELGAVISSAGTPSSGPTRAELAATLLPRMDMLVRFLFGLDAYYAAKYPQAAEMLASVDESLLSDVPFLGALVRLFEGVTAARLDDWQAAGAFYKQALELEPGNLRARYSIAEAVYYPARGDCASDQASPNGAKDNIDGLRDALAQFQAIAVEDNTPAATAMRGVLALAMGHTYLCLGQLGVADPDGAVDYLAEAEKKFSEAVGYFEQNERLTRDQRAEAYEGLGYTIISVPAKTAPENPDAANNWRRAAQHFCSATQLSGYANRQAAFHHLIAYIHGRLGEYERADVERNAAIALDPAIEAQYESVHAGWREQWATSGTSVPAEWSCQATS